MERRTQKALPIGTVITTRLSKQEFEKVLTAQNQLDVWRIADGNSLPANSAYGELTGSSNAPDLRFLGKSYSLVHLISRVADHGLSLKEVEAQFSPELDLLWIWHAGLRDIQGNRSNDFTWEQVENQFQVKLADGKVIAQGRNHNFHLNETGSWKPGDANLYGLGIKQTA